MATRHPGCLVADRWEQQQVEWHVWSWVGGGYVGTWSGSTSSVTGGESDTASGTKGHVGHWPSGAMLSLSSAAVALRPPARAVESGQPGRHAPINEQPSPLLARPTAGVEVCVSVRLLTLAMAGMTS